MGKVALVLFLLGSGCRVSDSISQPADALVLFGALKSYDSLSTVQQTLRPSSWQVLSTQSIPGRAGGDVYEIQGVSAGNAVDRGIAGELRLEFHNGKLSKAWFAPSDPQKYFAALGVAMPLSGQPPAETEEGNLLTQVGVADDGRPYVFWQDYRTVYQHAAFMRKHYL